MDKWNLSAYNSNQAEHFLRRAQHAHIKNSPSLNNQQTRQSVRFTVQTLHTPTWIYICFVLLHHKTEVLIWLPIACAYLLTSDLNALN